MNIPTTNPEAKAIESMARAVAETGVRWLRVGRRAGNGYSMRFRCERCATSFVVPVRVHVGPTEVPDAVDGLTDLLPYRPISPVLYGLPGSRNSWAGIRDEHPSRIKLIDPIGNRWRVWTDSWAEAFTAWHQDPHFCGGEHE